MCTCCTNKPSNIFNVILSIETEFMITLAGTTGNNSSAQATVSTENEIKSNGSQVGTDIKQPARANDSALNTSSPGTVTQGTSTARRLLEDKNSEGSQESRSKNSTSEVHAASVENDGDLEAEVDSSFDLLRDNDELGDEYNYDYDDFVNETMWGDEEWKEGQHEKLEDYVNIDSHILCTPVSHNSMFIAHIFVRLYINRCYCHCLVLWVFVCSYTLLMNAIH